MVVQIARIPTDPMPSGRAKRTFSGSTFVGSVDHLLSDTAVRLAAGGRALSDGVRPPTLGAMANFKLHDCSLCCIRLGRYTRSMSIF